MLDTNTQNALRKLRDRGLIDTATAATLLDAHALLQSLGQVTRLCFEGSFKPSRAPDGLKELLAHVGGQPDFDILEARMLEAMHASAMLFEEIIN